MPKITVDTDVPIVADVPVTPVEIGTRMDELRSEVADMKAVSTYLEAKLVQGRKDLGKWMRVFGEAPV